jgi:hypothetical protein
MPCHDGLAVVRCALQYRLPRFSLRRVSVAAENRRTLRIIRLMGVEREQGSAGVGI